MPAADTMEPADARLDPATLVDHAALAQGDRYEKEDHHHHGPESHSRRLYESATRLLRRGCEVHFGGQQSEFAAAREAQLAALKSEPQAVVPQGAPNFVGGEHQVFLKHPPLEVFKQTLPGYYGRYLDERVLLDPRTFLNVRMLVMRSALPSEYLLRWCVMGDVFGLDTIYLGVVRQMAEEPEMAVGQPFIPESPDDPATLDDVAAFFAAHGFVRVESRLIINPEIQEVTWYRQRDGLLMTDAHARNFRKDLNGLLIPIDLVISIVRPGASALLPPPDRVWKPSFLSSDI